MHLLTLIAGTSVWFTTVRGEVINGYIWRVRVHEIMIFSTTSLLIRRVMQLFKTYFMRIINLDVIGATVKMKYFFGESVIKILSIFRLVFSLGKRFCGFGRDHGNTNQCWELGNHFV